MEEGNEELALIKLEESYNLFLHFETFSSGKPLADTISGDFAKEWQSRLQAAERVGCHYSPFLLVFKLLHQAGISQLGRGKLLSHCLPLLTRLACKPDQSPSCYDPGFVFQLADCLLEGGNTASNNSHDPNRNCARSDAPSGLNATLAGGVEEKPSPKLLSDLTIVRNDNHSTDKENLGYSELSVPKVESASSLECLDVELKTELTSGHEDLQESFYDDCLSSPTPPVRLKKVGRKKRSKRVSDRRNKSTEDPGATKKRKLLVVERKKFFKCEICNTVFDSSNELGKHNLVHKDQKEFICHTCGKVFQSLNRYQSHMKDHSKAKTFICPECGKGYIYISHLNMHLATHSNERPFICVVCGKRFKDPATLSKHEHIHKEEKKFKCDICNKRFVRSGQLQKHAFTHTDLRLHQCKVCYKSFKHSSDITRHMRVHTGERPYSCSKCPKSFAQSGDLKRHLVLHERGRLKCEEGKFDICDEAVTEANNSDT